MSKLRRPARAASATDVPGLTPPCAPDCALRAEADHRMANHLTMLSAFVQLKGRELARTVVAPGDIQLLVQSLDGQIRAMGRLHRLLTFAEVGAFIDLGALLHEVCAPFASGLGSSVTLIEDLQPGCLVAPDLVMPISQIVSEAITNAMKHAYPGDGAGAVFVRCHSGLAHELWIEIEDHGAGLPADFEPLRDGGFGFHLMRGLSERLEASLAFERGGGGLRVRLDLPR